MKAPSTPAAPETDEISGAAPTSAEAPAPLAARPRRWAHARPHVTRIAASILVVIGTWAFVDHVTPGPYAPYLATVTGLAVLSQRYLRAPLGPTTAWALTAVLVAAVFAGTDLVAPSFTGCANAYAAGCGTRSTLDNAAMGLTIVTAAWLVLVPGYLLTRGASKVARRLLALTRTRSSKDT